MKRRYILYRRKRGGMFYIEDTETRKQESTGTRNRAEATSLLNARNESIRQPHLNLQIAKAYLAGTDSGVATRTWQQALDAIIETKSGSTQDRWRQAAKQAALDLIRNRVILETQAEQAGAFCQERGCSLGAGEESSPAPSEQNAKHEHNRKPHLNRMPRNRSAASQPSHQAGKIPGSTPGMENCFITRMSHTRHHATL